MAAKKENVATVETTVKETPAKAEVTATKVKVKCSLLNVRKSPSLDAPIVKTVKEGDVLSAVPSENGWFKIPGGFVVAEYVAKVE